MAIDNLNFYSNWLPAGQLTDKYSSQPWCLKSKNLDIFSSSKSVKATAWSTPSQTGADIIKQDWKLILKTDGKVYDISSWEEVLVVDPSVNFPVYQVSYNWKNGTYENAQWGTVQDMSVMYEWNEWDSFVVFTDRAMLVYSKIATVYEKEIDAWSWTQSSWVTENGYEFTADSLPWNRYLIIHIKEPKFWSMPLRLYCTEPETTDVTISVESITLDFFQEKYYYDAQLDGMIGTGSASKSISFSWTIQDGILVDIPIAENIDSYDYCRIQINITRTRREWKSWNSWSGGKLYLDINWWPEEDHRMTINNEKSDWDYHKQYDYLPVRERKLVSIWNYAYSQSYWIKGTSFQPLYKWNGTWVEDDGEKKIKYDFIADMWWETDPRMDVIWLITWNEQVYMIGNLEWNWYIIPCDLSWWRWTPYIAYGCTFTGVANIDYLMYLVWDDRGISQLRAYNWQELVKVIWWNKESNTNDLIDIEEQYKFDWKIVKYRWNLILSTSDNRIFEYGQTYGGKGWVFIHEIPWTIEELKSNWNDLEVKYTNNWATYITTYQDDTPIKNYNTEWEAVYPIVLWNHLLEKEESDLYVSYILPSAETSLEFWGMANHYHFWTFTSSDSYTFSTTASYKMKGCTWDYELKFIEKNGNQYTFRLEWDLPIQTTNDMKITDTEWTELINYSEYNHFRKIGEITTTEYQEWEFRFHNLNNKLELPKSHSLQIMVKGKGNQNYTPELFSLDLVANQRERW